MNVPFMCLLVATAALTAAPVRAADETSLFDTKNPLSGWTFGNGPEFPGAKGGIVVDEAVEPQHRPAIRLDGDFTAGGNYVQIGRSLPAIDLDALSFWMKAP